MLLQVFVYASHPLYDDNLAPTPAVPWLLAMAILHREFTKPALTALYRNPPILALNKSAKNQIIQVLLGKQREKMDYTVMVKRLELDATRMPRRTAASRPKLDVGQVIGPLKTLREMDIFDTHDRPPYRQPLRGGVSGRHYPLGIFTALEDADIFLRSWTWNHFLCSVLNMANAETLLWMKDIHSRKSFRSLRDLILTNFPEDSKGEPKRRAKDIDQDTEIKPTQEELLGTALAVLPKLRSLTFVSSTVVNERLLPLLPDRLVSLTIANCANLTAEILAAFLLTHGNFLEELILNHNIGLSLSFLPGLKPSCPRLEALRMDLNCYSRFSTSNTVVYLYDELLKDGEVPTWPSTLQSLEIIYLRKWTAATAKTFFQSLIDSAEDLPSLQELVLRASVEDVEWRERATFRDQLSQRFQKVFLAQTTPPSEHLISLRAFREWKASRRMDDAADEHTTTPVHISSQSEAMESSDSDAPILPKGTMRRLNRQMRRTRVSKRLQAIESDSEEEVTPTQGRCRIVNVLVDNLRPREALFGEDDFLDTEPSEDEEWNEDNDETVDEGTSYAW